jgi:hyperosmotically inducible periplasmic protein
VGARLLLVICLASALPACGRGPVHPPHSISFEDDAITARVKTALLNDPEIGAMKIDVATHDGVVTLSGTVPTKRDEARAIDLARRVEGVRQVASQLRTEN